MGSRIKIIQEYLAENALDAFLVMTKINRQYVSGFTGSAGIVVVTPSSPARHAQRVEAGGSPPASRGRKSGGGAELYVDDRYLIRAKRESSLLVKSLDKFSTSLPTSPHRLVRRVAVEDRITLRELKWLRKTLKARFVPTKDVVENLRAVKTIGEIRVIRECQRIVDRIFERIKKFVRTGMTEAAVSLEMERYAKKRGANGMAFESIVAFGANAAAPHHLSGKQKIKKGNFLLLDFGVLVKGYHSDFTRTLFIGRPNKKQELVYNTVLEAQKRGIGEIRGIGGKAATVDAAARGHIERAGFGKYFTHNTGHGVGLEIHELPNFSAKSEDILAKNMIVTVEPGIYIEKWGGVRIEDMILVTGRGPVQLSKSRKDFGSMIIK